MIFVNITSYYILVVLLSLFYILSLLNDKCKNKNNYFHFICDSYNPIRNLIPEKDLIKKYKEIFLSKAFEEHSNIQEIQSYLESFIAEFIINLSDRNVNITDSFIKVKFETKIYKILETYLKCYNLNTHNNIEIFKFRLIVKIIDILSKVNIDIFYTSKEIRRLLNKNKFYSKYFDSYCEHRKTPELNYIDLVLNLEEVENLYNILKIKI